MATLRRSIVEGFIQRGSDGLTASLAADLAMTVLGTALGRWIASDGATSVSTVVDEVLTAFSSLASDIGHPAEP